MQLQWHNFIEIIRLPDDELKSNILKMMKKKAHKKKQRIQFDMVHLVITFDDLNNAKQNEWMSEGAETIAHSNRSMLLLHRCTQLSDAHTHSITIPFNFIQSNWLSILFRRTYFTIFFLPLRFGRREEAQKKVNAHGKNYKWSINKVDAHFDSSIVLKTIEFFSLK